MKLGAHTMLWLDCLGDADLSLLDRISAFGYDAVEVVVGERPLCPRALADRLGRLGLSASVSCAIPPERAPGSPDPASRHAALRFFAVVLKPPRRSAQAILSVRSISAACPSARAHRRSARPNGGAPQTLCAKQPESPRITGLHSASNRSTVTRPI